MADNIKLPQITDDFRELVHYNPNTDDIVDAVQELMREAVRLNSQSVPNGMVLVNREALNIVLNAHDDEVPESLYLRPAAATPEKPQPKISTKHGPWVESTLHEGETYCKRCLTRSIFAGNRECDPHIVTETEEPHEMMYRGNSVAWWYSKATEYRAALDKCWDALRKAGIHPDGKTDVVTAIRQLAKRSNAPQSLGNQE